MHEEPGAAAARASGGTGCVSAMPELRDLPQQAAVLRRAVEYFERDERVTALVLSGSLASGEADRWSDVDLYIVADEHFDAVFSERQHAAAGVGEPMAQFTVLGRPGQSSDHIVLYSDLVKLDLMYYRASELEPHRRWANALVLKDVWGALSKVKERSRRVAVAPLSDDELLRLDQQFWVWTWYTFGKIMRGEHWEALNALHEIRSAAVVPLLLTLAEQHDEGYRRLESKLPDQRDAIARTVASLDPVRQHDALKHAVSLFTAARDALFAGRGLSPNAAAEAVVMAAIDRQWHDGPRC